MYMSTITLPIAKARQRLCELAEKVQSGEVVILTSHGLPKCVLTAYKQGRPRWRVKLPDNPAAYGDLQSPVLEEWP